MPASELIEERGGIRHGKDWLTWPEIIERYFQMEGCSIIGRAYLRRAGPLKSVPVFWEIGVVGVEIALDEETGKISLDTLVTVGDVGLAIHPAMTESQDLGAATMGLGIGLFEELIYDGQQLMNGTMLEYRVPRFSDLARRVELKLVENQRRRWALWRKRRRRRLGQSDRRVSRERAIPSRRSAHSQPAVDARARVESVAGEEGASAERRRNLLQRPNLARAEACAQGSRLSVAHDHSLALRNPSARQRRGSVSDARPLRR